MKFFHISYIGFDMSAGIKTKAGPNSSIWANECLDHPGDILSVIISGLENSQLPSVFHSSFITEQPRKCYAIQFIPKPPNCIS